MSAKIYLDRIDPKVEPYSPENQLIVMNGPIVGTSLPGSSRFSVSARSPLTNLLGYGTCGGNFGSELKWAGFDGIILNGTASKPVYLYVKDEKYELRDASDLWGKDTYETTEVLKQRHGKKAKVLCIGQAGEKLVRFAAIANDRADFVGRTGMGAVMGSKKLKAIVVEGSKKVPVAYPELYEKTRSETVRLCKESVIGQSLRQMGTDAAMDLGMMTGDIPIKNWQVGQDLELSSSLGGPAMTASILTKVHACYACPIACKRVVKVTEGPYKVEEGPGPEYETCCTFGTMLMNKDLAVVAKANELCNRYGMDTISCGATIAFAMDAYDKGIITKKETGNIELTWGNGDAILSAVKLIGERRDFGDLLAEGTRLASQKIGRGAEDLAVQVKGLEVPMHDPRGYHGMGLAYAVCNRGSCHNQHVNLYVEQGMVIYSEAGLKENYKSRTSEGKAEMTYLCENLGMPLAAALLCMFVMGCIQPHHLADMVRGVSGFDYDLKEIMEVGERIWLLHRGVNNILGLSSKDDNLPKRILTPVPDGPARNSVPDINKMLREYYSLRGLNENGVPSRDRLEKFGLKELSDRLYS